MSGLDDVSCSFSCLFNEQNFGMGSMALQEREAALGPDNALSPQAGSSKRNAELLFAASNYTVSLHKEETCVLEEFGGFVFVFF